ncbi:MAG: class II aldolase/adducin family protein [Alphaproteobacteria bacterium]|nr:class II aldolase/adducin family protein [Alphaproteobacteria bacterium]
MTSVARLKTAQSHDRDEWQLRVDLAAAFRLCARYDWHEAVANHLSLAVSPDGKKFLMNPRWRHFSRIKASELLLLDSDDQETMNRPDAPDLTAWCLHGRLHAALPQARCIIHLHPPYGTAIASLANPEIPPIDQNTARFFNRVAFDMEFGGMANTEDEGDRLARLMGNKQIMMMGNHGILVCAATVAEAFDLTYYLERACRNLVLAYQTGQRLHVMSPSVAEKTAQEWEAYGEQPLSHFEEMKEILDSEDSSYAE